MAILDRFNLDGRTAFVTGGGTGIGKGFALALAEAGADVALAGRTAATLDSVAHEIEGLGRKSMVFVADVSIKQNVDRAVDKIVESWGKLDIAANNAGVGGWVKTHELDEATWDHLMSINLKGAFFCCQAEARVMQPRGYGKIINNASMAARIITRPQYQVHYNTSKAGLVHMTRSLAAEWAPLGIYVNSISPGYTRTELADSPQTREAHSIWLRDTPLGRMGRDRGYARRPHFPCVRRVQLRYRP